MDDAKPTPTETASAPAPAPARPSWWSRLGHWGARLLAWTLVLLALLVVGGGWFASRESTVRWIAEQIAQASGGKIALDGVRGSLIEGVAIDATGQPTRDPAAALQGAILPFGGYKGFAMALMMQGFGVLDLTRILAGPTAARTLAEHGADVLMVAAEDLVGDVEQPNLPGTYQEHPNWRRRLSIAIEELRNDPRMQAITAAIRRQRGGR